jgi:hypothetical protein
MRSPIGTRLVSLSLSIYFLFKDYLINKFIVIQFVLFFFGNFICDLKYEFDFIVAFNCFIQL